jgi:hypothetical protein
VAAEAVFSLLFPSAGTTLVIFVIQQNELLQFIFFVGYFLTLSLSVGRMIGEWEMILKEVVMA